MGLGCVKTRVFTQPGSKAVSLSLRTTIPLHPRKQTYRLQQPARSRKHRRTSLGELHVGPALVHHSQPLAMAR
jgi:hypothetical protein